ncbi:MAG: DUF1080 domain-containing protein [Verrucomicrobia bacterium]|jgi:hypothetical protein|nr:DUF1080 domain-containing protein [Verrucomicrobiota bacterium]
MKNPFPLVCCCGLVAAALSGCVSERFKPSGVSPQRETISVPSAPKLDEPGILAQAAAQPPAPVGSGDWQPLFDGESLHGWRVTKFDGGGKVEVRQGLIALGAGDPFTGVNYTNDAPKVNYEIALEAMRVGGSDFFCGLTFPVRDAFCSLIIGGWGGSVVGLSNVDSMDASENETTQFIDFATGRWYHVRLRVTEQKIEAWIEQKKVVNLTSTGRKISQRFGDIELSKPLGIASWMTSAAVREIKIRHVTTPDSPTE